MTENSKTLRVHSDPRNISPHPLSDHDPARLDRLIENGLPRDGVIVYMLQTCQIGRRSHFRKFYVFEQISEPMHWTSPFSGDEIIGIASPRYQEQWGCEGDAECLKEALKKAERDFALFPSNTRDQQEVVSHFLINPLHEPAEPLAMERAF